MMKDKFVPLRLTIEEFELIEKVIKKEHSVCFCSGQNTDTKKLHNLLIKIWKTKEGIKDD